MRGYRYDVALLTAAVIGRDKEILPLVRERIGDPTNEYHLHIGPMACGSAVVANSEVVDKQIRSSQFAKCLFENHLPMDA